MKIVIKNIGVLDGPVVLEPKALTVLSGGNNTGKTYVMYILWMLYQRRFRHVFSFAEQLASQLRETGSIQISLAQFCSEHWSTVERGIGEGLRKHLPELFSAAPSFFSEAQISVNLDQNSFINFAQTHPKFSHSIEIGQGSIDVRLATEGKERRIALTALDVGKIPLSLLSEIVSALFIELVLGATCESAFLLPAERGGLNLFYMDLDAKSSALVRSLKRDDINPMQIFKELLVAQYAQPIDAYIQFLKKAPRISKGIGAFHDHAMLLQKEITRVRYKVNKDGVITVKPYRSDAELGIHLTSSTVKSFYGLWAWLEMQAKSGDCLMIDEPELNLHPDNQRAIARLLVSLVNRGVKVVISTHSDYIVRELNNMAMLSSDFPERVELERKYGYDEEGAQRLSTEAIAAYHFNGKNVTECTISDEFGIEVTSMDESINKLNASNSAIYFALSGSRHAIEVPVRVKEVSGDKHDA